MMKWNAVENRAGAPPVNSNTRTRKFPLRALPVAIRTDDEPKTGVTTVVKSVVVYVMSEMTTSQMPVDDQIADVMLGVPVTIPAEVTFPNATGIATFAVPGV